MREIDKEYRQQLDELIERAKGPVPNPKGLRLGERFFLEMLIHYIEQYRTRRLTADELTRKKKELEKLLIDYWDQAKMFREDARIRVTMSTTLAQAARSGCPTCEKLIRIFDGREKA